MQTKNDFNKIDGRSLDSFYNASIKYLDIARRRTLLRARHFEFQLRHLLVVVVLVLAFTTAFIMRSYPIKYGFFLNEFDPYFDYRASKYIVDNGLDAYWKWHDTMSWFPEGRDVPKTSQSGLH